MLVSELIAKLQEMPQELEVMTDGYEGGIDLIYAPRIVDVGYNVNQSHDYLLGRHELAIYLSPYMYAPSKMGKAVYMTRKRI